jgi:hypothetical protein
LKKSKLFSELIDSVKAMSEQLKDIKKEVAALKEAVTGVVAPGAMVRPLKIIKYSHYFKGISARVNQSCTARQLQCRDYAQPFETNCSLRCDPVAREAGQ